MDARYVRALVAKGEGLTLDFKRDQYPWNTKGEVELAKDLTAMANTLDRDAEPAHVLVGVDDPKGGRRKIVGIPDERIADAEIQQKVARYLNRVPHFHFDTVKVGSKVVGVFSITPGDRPFFFNGKGGTRKHVAWKRQGTASVEASPDDVAEWVALDRPDPEEAAELVEVRKLARELDLAGIAWDTVSAMLSRIHAFATSRSARTRLEVLEGVRSVLRHARSHGLPEEIAEQAAGTAYEALPGEYWLALHREADIAVCRAAARFGSHMAYEALKAKLGLGVLDAGVNLLGEVLRRAHDARLTDLSEKTIEEFDQLAHAATRFRQPDACRWIKYKRMEAVTPHGRMPAAPADLLDKVFGRRDAG